MYLPHSHLVIGMKGISVPSIYFAPCPRCLTATLDFQETFDAHLQERHPERVATHSRRTLTVYTGVAVLAGVAVMLAVLLLKWLLLVGGVVLSYALQAPDVLEPSEGLRGGA